MNLKSFAAFAAIVLSILSCNNKKQDADEATRDFSQLEKRADADDAKTFKTDMNLTDTVKTPVISEDKNQTTTKPSIAKDNFVDWDKKIIKTADLSVEVKDYKDFNSKVKSISKKYGGYISKEEQNQDSYKIENKLSIKVPVAQFEDAMNELGDISEKVTERNISSDDVTTEIVDTKSRIEAKKQVRDKYLEFLKGAKNMQDVLTVQSEINGVQEELETANGRVQYLNHGAAYSTINLTYFQVLNPTAVNPAEPTATTFGQNAAAAFGKGWDFIKNVIVGLLNVWPLLLGIALFVIWYKRTNKKDVDAPVKKADQT